MKKRIEELERLLGMNSKNLSKPPSSDPPGMSAILPRHRRKKRGAKNRHQPLPDEVKRKHFGPGVLALVAVLTGMLNTSKHKALAMINEVFSVPTRLGEAPSRSQMSLGGLSNCEAQLADALVWAKRPAVARLEHPYNEFVVHCS